GPEREALIHLEPGGVVESFPLPGGGRRWVVHTGDQGADPSPERLASLVQERTGVDLDPGSCTMLSAFTVRQRTARRLLSGRCVLLGDAAHEVSPIGGQGITLGWLDALELTPLLTQHVTEQRAGALQADQEWCRAERRIRRRARLAGMIAGVNTALGRPVGPRLSALRAAAVRAALRTPLRRGLACVCSMGWPRPGGRIRGAGSRPAPHSGPVLGHEKGEWRRRTPRRGSAAPPLPSEDVRRRPTLPHPPECSTIGAIELSF